MDRIKKCVNRSLIIHSLLHSIINPPTLGARSMFAPSRRGPSVGWGGNVLSPTCPACEAALHALAINTSKQNELGALFWEEGGGFPGVWATKPPGSSGEGLSWTPTAVWGGFWKVSRKLPARTRTTCHVIILLSSALD